MWSKDKIFSRADLPAIVAAWKQEGKKIVFTNGCFDLLHLGHVDYLERPATSGKP